VNESTNGSVPRGATVELRMQALPENLALARLALAGVALNAGLPDDAVADLKLAVTEACTNAIQHAYPGGAGSEQILVRYTAAPGALAVEVEDAGGGFDYESAAGRRRDESDGRGLGLMIIRELTDELTVASGETGSRIVFVKRFSSES
jgi:serine/threonine-protein kinase RsbW